MKVIFVLIIGLLCCLLACKETSNRKNEEPIKVSKAIDTIKCNHYYYGLEDIPNECYEKLTELFLVNSDLKEIPSEVYKMKNVEYFDFSGNYLTDIPDSLALLKKLKTLILADNSFKAVPCNIVGFDSLKSLNLFNNRISEANECVCNKKGNSVVIEVVENKMKETMNFSPCLGRAYFVVR